MRFMCFQWGAFGQDDLEDSLLKLGIELDSFSYRFTGIHEDQYLLRNFKAVLARKKYDAVISWNFWPIIAQVCFELSVRYIAWGYDCPISFRILPWASYPTSHLVLFDRAEYIKYKKLGVKNIHHLPLAVNTERIDGIEPDEKDIERFDADISFLGTMYEVEYGKYMSVLTEWERGYIEAVVRSQGEFYGSLIYEDVIPDSFLKGIMDRWNDEGILNSSDWDNFKLWFMEIIGKERTKRDRIGILNRIGDDRQYEVRYYSFNPNPEITGAKFFDALGYSEEMFKMFRLTRINLNITYRLITKGIPLRALDIMAAGGFLLSNWQEELAENFKPGIDFAYYNNIKEAVEIADYYLNHEDERLAIAKNGHEAVRRFDYRIQVRKLLDMALNSQ